MSATFIELERRQRRLFYERYKETNKLLVEFTRSLSFEQRQSFKERLFSSLRNAEPLKNDFQVMNLLQNILTFKTNSQKYSEEFQRIANEFGCTENLFHS